MAKANKPDDQQKITADIYADQKGLNKYQRFALVKQYPVEENSVFEWEEICKKINL